MLAKLVECTDHREVYGILKVHGVSLEEVQNEIYKIKERFANEGNDTWYLGDLFKEFPEDWNWHFETDCIVNVIEI